MVKCGTYVMTTCGLIHFSMRASSIPDLVIMCSFQSCDVFLRHVRPGSWDCAVFNRVIDYGTFAPYGTSSCVFSRILSSCLFLGSVLYVSVYYVVNKEYCVLMSIYIVYEVYVMSIIS